ncbi:hypothetical protein COCCADRAFT_88733, partial [Bipolaris zeicola 26-R-13]
PQLMILNPDLCTTMPPSVWLSTGMRTVYHFVEAFCSVGGMGPSTEEAALRGLRHLILGLLEY